MYNEDILTVSESAYKKVSLLKKNFLGYFILSVLAGVYVGLGVLFAYCVGAYLHDDFTAYKFIMGFCFSAALSFVYFAGAELFTGNNFVMSLGAMRKRVTWLDAIKIWVVCYIGNLIGSLILGGLVLGSGVLNDHIGEFIAQFSSSKINLEPLQLILRGILCNFLVCLATWCGYRLKTEIGKLIMIFWCIIVFFTIGFEHSVANMSLLFLGAINPYETGNTFAGMFYNISLATVGNMIGGIVFLAIPYLLTFTKDDK